MQELNVWPSKESEDENSESEEVEEQEKKMGLLNNADLHGVDLRKAKHEPKPKSEYLVCWNRNEISEEIAKKIFYYHSLEVRFNGIFLISCAINSNFGAALQHKQGGGIER